MKIEKIIKGFNEDLLNVRRIKLMENGTVILIYKNKTQSYLHFKNGIPTNYIKLKLDLDKLRRK